MIRVSQQNCARSYEWTFVGLHMGVERRADVVCLQNPPGERGNIGISHSEYELRKRNRVWTAIWGGSGLVADELTDLSRGANDDVIATDVRRRGRKIKLSLRATTLLPTPQMVVCRC